MKKVLLSAFACDPFKGSEPACGWNWAVGLAQKKYEVHCLTRGTNRPAIERHPGSSNVYFHYVSLPFGFEGLYKLSQAGMYFYYFLWQWLAYRVAIKLHKRLNFDLAHHVSWGNFFCGSFLYKLPIPLLFGPAGSGQRAPAVFKDYFLSGWSAELKRELAAKLLLRFNPACSRMIRAAKAVIVSNRETLELAERNGAKNPYLSLDVAIPADFFPPSFPERKREEGRLKLLWTGRFLPRKGLPLVLEVMKELRPFPEITLTIVGDGEVRADVEKRVKAGNLEQSVRLAGSVSHQEIRSFYASHDVFFFTSLRDSCPSQLIEAMAYGLPVVTLDLHGQAVIVSERTGIKVPVTSPEKVIQGLAGAILDLFGNPARYNAMSRAAYDFANQQTWERKIEEITSQFYTKRQKTISKES